MSDQQQQKRLSKWDMPASSTIPEQQTQDQTIKTTTTTNTASLDLNDRMKLVQDAAKKINEQLYSRIAEHTKIKPPMSETGSFISLSSSPPPPQPSSQPTVVDQPMSMSAAVATSSSENDSSSTTATPPPPPHEISMLPFIVGPDNTLIKEIEINNVRNRYLLTKVATLSDIERDTGAAVTVKGKYYRDGEVPLSSTDERPLFLHIAAENEEQMNKATARIEQIMKQAPSFLTAKVSVDIENPDPHFNIPANIIGKGGINVKHITQATGGTRVQLKGKGSEYRDQGGQVDEDDEPMYLHLSSSNQQNLDKAKKLAESLLNKVRQNHDKFVNQRKHNFMDRQQRHQEKSPVSIVPPSIQPPPSIGGPPSVAPDNTGVVSVTETTPTSATPSLYYQQYYGYPTGTPAPTTVTAPTDANSAQYSAEYQQYYNYYYGAGYPTSGSVSTPLATPAPGTYGTLPPAPPGVSSTPSTFKKKKRPLDDSPATEESPLKVMKHDDGTSQPPPPPSSNTTDTATLYNGLTEQEYYNQYYQNYYAQQQQAAQYAGQYWQQSNQPPPPPPSDHPSDGQ